MTAELCDCFATKAEGVRFILAQVLEAIEDTPLIVWGTDGRFHPVAFVLQHPQVAAAANWLALAEAVAGLVDQGPGLLIDVGSTTTDLIPIRGGKAAPAGRTDMQRLRSGELVYAGVRRTPVCALATEFPYKGSQIGIAAELFATTLDVYLVLGDIGEDFADTGTADGRPASRDHAHDRLARMVGADREGVTADDIRELAMAADRALVARLAASAKRVLTGELASTVVVSGSGEFLARRVAGLVQSPEGKIVSLAGTWGRDASSAGCAHALLLLAQGAQA